MSKFKLGLQLYTVRDEMEKDVEATLKAVSEMGYEVVEPAGYFGKTAEEFRALLDKYNLKAISVHQVPDVFLTEPEKNVEFLKTLGVKYCAIPWMGLENHKGSENFEKSVQDISSVAKLLKENGITMLYHNHDFEFNKFDGKYLLDWLYEAVGTDLLKPEIDTCWVKYAGADVTAYMKKYSGMLDCLHLKDFECDELGAGPVYDLIDSTGKAEAPKSKEERNFRFRPVGHGMQNFDEILKTATECGTKYLIVEQDNSYEASSLESAKLSIEYLKSKGL